MPLALTPQVGQVMMLEVYDDEGRFVTRFGIALKRSDRSKSFDHRTVELVDAGFDQVKATLLPKGATITQYEDQQGAALPERRERLLRSDHRADLTHARRTSEC